MAIIHTEQAPAPIGPYSQAVTAGNFLFVSGQIPIDPKTNELKKGSIGEQTKYVMQNIEALLNASGYGFEHIVKTSIFLTTMENFAAVNEVYGSYFKTDFPARETVAVLGLPKNAEVEISVIAFKK